MANHTFYIPVSYKEAEQIKKGNSFIPELRPTNYGYGIFLFNTPKEAIDFEGDKAAIIIINNSPVQITWKPTEILEQVQERINNHLQSGDKVLEIYKEFGDINTIILFDHSCIKDIFINE